MKSFYIVTRHDLSAFEQMVRAGDVGGIAVFDLLREAHEAANAASKTYNTEFYVHIVTVLSHLPKGGVA